MSHNTLDFGLNMYNLRSVYKKDDNLNVFGANVHMTAAQCLAAALLGTQNIV